LWLGGEEPEAVPEASSEGNPNLFKPIEPHNCGGSVGIEAGFLLAGIAHFKVPVQVQEIPARFDITNILVGS